MAQVKLEIVRNPGKRVYRRISLVAGRSKELQGATVKVPAKEKGQRDFFKFIPHQGIGSPLQADTHAALMSKVKARLTRLGRPAKLDMAEEARKLRDERHAAEAAQAQPSEALKETVAVLEDMLSEVFEEVTTMPVPAAEAPEADLELN